MTTASDRLQLIRDIRYFESSMPNQDYSPMPSEIGAIFPNIPESIAIGARIARKLCELGFLIRGFSHIYINLSTSAPIGNISFSPRGKDPEHPWFRYVDVGAVPRALQLMSPSEHEQWLMDITFRVLRFISQDLPDQAAQINSVANLLAEYGENLQIVHKRKRTKSYEVEITYSIGGSRSPSLAYIRVHDMLAKKRYYGEFLKLRFYEDIFFLVSTITKRGSTIILAPRTSTKAGIYNEWYKVPMLIELDSLPQEK